MDDFRNARGDLCVNTPCEQCLVPFAALTHDLRRGRGRFCSKSCAATFSNARKTSDQFVQRTDLRVRFWRMVDKDGPTQTHVPGLGPCWQWTGGKVKDGYGRFSLGNHVIRYAHQVSWMIEHGQWPDLCVLHRCDNPPCVNPGHLFLGTIADNNRDMWSKGRGKAKGVHPRAG